jgi:hypothetical protein
MEISNSYEHEVNLSGSQPYRDNHDIDVDFAGTRPYRDNVDDSPIDIICDESGDNAMIMRSGSTNIRRRRWFGMWTGISIVVVVIVVIVSVSVSKSNNNSANESSTTSVSSTGSSTWVMQGEPWSGVGSNNGYGHAVALSGDGNLMAIAQTGSAESAGFIDVVQWNVTSSGWEFSQTLMAPVPDRVHNTPERGPEHQSVTMSADSRRIAFSRGDMVIVFAKDSAVDKEWVQFGNILAPFEHEAADHHFGRKMSFADDGSTLVVLGDTGTTGVARVFVDDPAVTDPQASGQWNLRDDVLLAQNGGDVSLAAGGMRMAVGISTPDGGEVKVFEWNSTVWSLLGQPIPATTAAEEFGGTLDLSDDGSILAVGTQDGNGNIVRIFQLEKNGDETVWVQLGQTLRGSLAGQRFGAAVRLSKDGNILAVGAPGTTVRVDTDPNLFGRVQIFAHNKKKGQWQLDGLIVSDQAGDLFGSAIALSWDGNRVACGAPLRDANSVYAVGAVPVYQRK